MSPFIRFASAIAIAVPGAVLADLTLTPTTDTLPLSEGLSIAGVSDAARRTINVDAVMAAMIEGRLTSATAIKSGDAIDLPGTLRGGKATWEAAKTEGEALVAPRNGYVACTVVAQQARVMVLEARGHGMVFVNGEPRSGDPYNTGYVRIPIGMRAGPNQLLFATGRGNITARLVAPAGEIQIDTVDVTTPDVLAETTGHGPRGAWLLAAPVMNCGDKARKLELSARVKGDAEWGTPERFTIAPLSVVKTPTSVRAVGRAGQKDVAIELRVMDAEHPEAAAAGAEIVLGVRSADQKHKRTFRSAIDGSVQYYAVVPAAPPENNPAGVVDGPNQRAVSPRTAMVLSLHGAAVEATSQANCYAQRPGIVVVCPTNRRPYGFDWEDWGRMDGIEVMRDAAAIYNTDPLRTFVTGHSMGGHGTWQFGALFPQVFAAVAPSAGWLSFESYTGRGRTVGAPANDPIAAILGRSTASSDSAAHFANLQGKPIYILHGSVDDNVPVAQAHRARDELVRLGIPFQYHEEEGANHWWGDKCVDWPGFFEMFSQSSLTMGDPRAGTQRHRFMVMQCGASGAAGGPVVVEQQEREGLASTVDVTIGLANRHVTGTTSNVAALSIEPGSLMGKGAAKIELDGSSFEMPVVPGHSLLVVKNDGKWRRAPGGERSTMKTAAMGGPFKQAFTSGFVLVYGTSGSADENAWSFAKARYDGEQWQYRGNGRAAVLSDTQYLAERPGGNVILYGNRDTNRAWERVLGRSAVNLRRGAVVVGDKVIEGDDAACLFLQPWRAADDQPWRLAGVVGGTGLKGMRATERLSYFLAGTGFPDVMVARSAIWSDGYGAVVGAGFFNGMWGTKGAEIVWRDATAAITPAEPAEAPAKEEGK